MSYGVREERFNIHSQADSQADKNLLFSSENHTTQNESSSIRGKPNARATKNQIHKISLVTICYNIFNNSENRCTVKPNHHFQLDISITKEFHKNGFCLIYFCKQHVA